MAGAGIDYGIKRVAIVIPTSTVFHDVNLDAGRKASDTKDIDALDTLAAIVHDTITRHHVTHVCVESPIVGSSRNMQVGIRMAMVAGAIVSTIRNAGADVELVAPATWKKAVTGVGNADKEHIRAWLHTHHEHWEAQCFTQDLVDATCLALLADSTLARRRPVHGLPT